MKVLFITRKFPPQIGGMEEFSKQFYEHLTSKKEIIALGKTNIHLLWFIPYAFFKSLFIAHRFDIIHLGDGALGLFGLLIKKITDKPITATIHGLDVTYQNKLYQKYNVTSLSKLDHIFAVSNNTAKIAKEYGIPQNIISVIPNGVSVKKPHISKLQAKKEIFNELNIPYSNKPMLLTVGRLVKRKGHEWFISKVTPLLQSHFTYIIAGVGEEEGAINKAIKTQKKKTNIFLVGKISREKMIKLYRAADIYIMPNQITKNSVEGFGIVAIEAASQGTPVVASHIEGIEDAVTNETGYLVEPTAKNFAKIIHTLLSDKERRNIIEKRAPQRIEEKYNWKKLIISYETRFKNLL